MLYVVLGLQVVVLIVVALLLMRQKPASGEADPRLARLLEADLPAQFARLDARGEAQERHLREGLAQARTEAAEDARRSREAAETAAAALRGEVLGSVTALGSTIKNELGTFREDNGKSAERLRLAVDATMRTLSDRFANFTAESLQHHVQSRDALHSRLNELGEKQTEHQEKLRSTVEGRLDALNQSNAAKLEEMRQTVDEKLHATLQSRIDASFSQVQERLAEVHQGLGQMQTLSTGVSDLNRIFSNVKSRGGFAEVQLGKLLEQVLAPGQYVENARVKEGTQEVVEYAVRFPGVSGDVLLPIDAKFPREDWDRLETAYEQGAAAEIEAARKAFAAAILTEGKRICSKYINEPVTTPYAIMFLPTESLYAEVLRRDGLQSDLHLNCRVMVAGPANLYALLTSFQLGFRMLNLQKKGDEVWKVLASAQTEFQKFGLLMDKMDKQVATVQNTIRDLGTRTRAINRTLRDVSAESAGAPLSAATQTGFDGLLPMIAAGEDE